MTETDFVFSAEHMLPTDHKIPPRLTNYRNYLHSSFNRQVGLLLESKRPRPQHSRKGRLDTRRAYRFPFSENIFKTYQDVPSSDTTIIMLIDGSGSMSNSAVQYEDYWIDHSVLKRLKPNNYKVHAYYVPDIDGAIKEVFL